MPTRLCTKQSTRAVTAFVLDKLFQRTSLEPLILFLIVVAFYSPLGNHGLILLEDQTLPFVWWQRLFHFSFPVGLAHWLNIILHALNVVLVFSLLQFLRLPKLAALGGALAFAFHPLQVETVAWIYCFESLFSTTMGLIALISYLKRGQPGVSRAAAMVFALAGYLLALWLSPRALVFPLVAFFIEKFWTRRHVESRAILGFVSFAVGFFLVFAFSPNLYPAFAADVSILQRLALMGNATTFQLAKTLIPQDLSLDYGRAASSLLTSSGLYWTALVPVLLLVSARLIVSGELTCILLLFFLLVSPLMGNLGLRIPAHSLVGDRFAYLALLSVALLVGWLLSRPKLPTGQWLVVIVLGGWAYLSTRQIPLWKQDLTLFSHILVSNPQSFFAHVELGQSYEKRGELENALQEYQTALSLDPNSVEARFSLGALLGKMRRFEESERLLSQVLTANPQDSSAHLVLGINARQQGYLERSLSFLTRAVEIAPASPLLRRELGKTLGMLGKYQEAEQHFAAAVKLEPRNGESANELGTVLVRVGKWREAIESFERSLVLFPDYSEAHLNLADAYSKVKEFAKAVPHYEAFLKQHPEHPEVRARLNGALNQG